jgi:enoyl-[acyl-carrier protein] reductase II
MGGGIRRIDNATMADKLSLYAGQGVGQVNRIKPASDIVRELAAGFMD